MGGSKAGEKRRAAGRFAVSSKPPLARAHFGNKAPRRHGPLSAISRRVFKAFPSVFKYPPVPLAIAIGPKLCQLLRSEFKPAEVRAFLHAWTSGPRYLKAVLRGEMRRNLDGSPAGLPEPKHRVAATERLKAIGPSGARPPAEKTKPTGMANKSNQRHTHRRASS
jgi:sRNA-binding protein